MGRIWAKLQAARKKARQLRSQLSAAGIANRLDTLRRIQMGMEGESRAQYDQLQAVERRLDVVERRLTAVEKRVEQMGQD